MKKLLKQWKYLLLSITILEIVLLSETYIIPIVFKDYNFNTYPFICVLGTGLIFFLYPEKILDKIKTKKFNIFLSTLIYVATLSFLCYAFFDSENLIIFDIKKHLKTVFIFLFIAIFEELICKKVIFEFLSIKINNFFAIILSIIFFIINHQYFWDNWRWISYFVFASISFTCYFIYPSIFCSIIFHFLYNLILLLFKR